MLVTGWITASTEPGAFESVPSDTELDWSSAVAPFRGSDEQDHWFRVLVEAAGPAPTLELGGLATLCDVYVDGDPVLRSESMFLSHEVDLAPGRHELAVCARALAPVLAQSRRPRARWRTRVVPNGNLRWVRTSFFGRAPGFAPGPPLVGPWRQVELLERPRLRADLRTAVDGRDGVLEVRSSTQAGPLEVTTEWGTTQLPPGGGSVRASTPELWWPHTHGDPALHEVRVRAEHGELERRVGFRRLAAAGDPERDGLDLHVNGVPVFARGAVWAPTPPGETYATLALARDGGLNLIRVVGTMMYEDAGFHEACDELGLLVWQDLMFANLDYPFVDESFAALAEAEVRAALRDVGGRPSLAVVCGNSEVEQQVAMLGLAPELGRSAFFSTTVPALMRESGIDAAYVPSAPCGGTFPFRTNEGIANYFGVGAYLRPLEDVRRAEVRFASECLAFANVPDADPADRTQGVMKDADTDWDFADVRDHYLRSLRGVGPDDPDYWEQARFVTGEVMAAVFGEWRRAASPSSGGIVLWLRDLLPGSGWGLLDAEGTPKVAWHVLRRALAPVSVWLVDEGLNGLSVHVANDTAQHLRATLRVALYRNGETPVAAEEEAIQLAAHSAIERDAEAMVGRFGDVTYAYRFGAPQQDVVVATLERDGAQLAQAFQYPVAAPAGRRTAGELGLHARLRSEGAATFAELETRRSVRGVRIDAVGLVPDDDAFDLEPGRARTIRLRPAAGAAPGGRVLLRALDLAGSIEVGQ